MSDLKSIAGKFQLRGTPEKILPLGSGLINDTYRIVTAENNEPDYVLQRINHHIFQNVDALQRNIECVTAHIRKKLIECGEKDINRKVLTFLPTNEGRTYWFDGESYWRIMLFIADSYTYETVNPEFSYQAGVVFGNFQAMLTDIPDKLTETLPGFHNMELRIRQFHEAVQKDPVNRVAEVMPIIHELERRSFFMCQAERFYREGRLPKRICHCDTKVNNILFDEQGRLLCVIDLDTVMPSFIFSDYGDFLRSAANTGAEDDKELDHIHFDLDIFKAFTQGYLESAHTFLSPLEIEMLPYAAALFPYMQCVRFLTDYLLGDSYYKIQYPDHNLVRTKAQLRLLECVEEETPLLDDFIRKSYKIQKNGKF